MLDLDRRSWRDGQLGGGAEFLCDCLEIVGECLFHEFQ
jgi:hypothetical protein